MFLCSAKGMNWLSRVKREPNYPLKITTSNEMLAHENTPQANLQSYYGTKSTPHTKKSKAKLRFILLALLTSRSSIFLLLGALVGCNNDGQGMSNHNGFECCGIFCCWRINEVRESR